MKFVDEFRGAKPARSLASAIKAAARADARYQFMEFCGGHTHTIFRYGIPELLPDQIRLIHGPGCPVCVLPTGRLDMALRLAKEKPVSLASYGDMLRVPGSGGESLLRAKASGADVRMVYSPLDALALAAGNPAKEVVFLAIGFETTAPATAAAVLRAKALGLDNFSVLCNHLLTPSAVSSILESTRIRGMAPVRIDGFIGPGHVAAVIGTRPFEFFSVEYQKPVVVAGFEPLDLLSAILALVRQVNEGRFEVENAYARAASRDGNETAKRWVAEVFELRRSFEWRSLGDIPYSALRLKSGYAEFDAELRYGIKETRAPEPEGCLCGEVLRGVSVPTDCPLFAGTCTPESPVGSCMVSQEGTCAAYYRFKAGPRAGSERP